MARAAWASLSKRCVLFWSPKAGNTSLAAWFARAVGFEERQGLNRETLERANFRVDHELARELIERLEFANFVLARNPYARAASAFSEKFRHDRFDRMEDLSRRMFRSVMAFKGRDPEPDDAGGVRGFSFVEYLEFVEWQVARARPGEEPRLNYHWSTQTPLAYADFSYGDVLKLETIERDVGRLNAFFGVDLPFPETRVHSRRAAAAQPAEDLSEVDFVELARSGVSRSASSLLSPRARRLIRSAYAIDFAKLGYDPDEA